MNSLSGNSFCWKTTTYGVLTSPELEDDEEDLEPVHDPNSNNGNVNNNSLPFIIFIYLEDIITYNISRKRDSNHRI